MSDNGDTLAQRLAEAMDGEQRQAILRFPCACMIPSVAADCPHVTGEEARRRGAEIDLANRLVAERVLSDPRAKKGDRDTAENYLYGVPPCQAIEEVDAP